MPPLGTWPITGSGKSSQGPTWIWIWIWNQDLDTSLVWEWPGMQMMPPEFAHPVVNARDYLWIGFSFVSARRRCFAGVCVLYSYVGIQDEEEGGGGGEEEKNRG